MKYNDFTENGPCFEQLDPKEGAKRLIRYQALFEAKAKKLNAYRQGEDLFGLPSTAFEELEKIKRDLALLSTMYTLYLSFTKSVEEYNQIPYKNLAQQVKKIRDELKLYEERVDKIPKNLMLYLAFQEMRVSIRALFEILPIVEDLVKPSMRERHWREVVVVTQTVFDTASPTFGFRDLAEAMLQKQRFKIQDICLSADEELHVEDKVEMVAQQWNAAKVTFKNFKSIGPVLFDGPALQVLAEAFEETQILLQSLSVSKYALPFKDSIDEHLQNFSMFMELMEIWRGVQHVWWYVGVVFSSEDVGKQLPHEAQRFHKVNGTYIDLMQQAFALRYVPLLHEKNEEFRTTLNLVMEDLEVCEKHLAGYLDAKRDLFPRLHYISDKVLLEALSQTSGLDSIQTGGVLSLFGNIKRLVLAQGDFASGCQMIEAVQSEEGELLELLTPVRENSVEILLTDIDRQIRASLQLLTRGALKSMVPNLASLEIQVLVTEHPCQSCILAMQCWFANLCVEAFSPSADMTDMKEVSRKMMTVCEQLAGNLRGHLARTIRAKFEVLCVVSIMHHDTVREFIRNTVKEQTSWDWQKQLKFSTDEHKGVYLEMIMYKSLYTYEFVGSKKRMVCSAQSNKSYLFLLHAIASHQCSLLAGPSGCGKSETIQELGRLLGR